MSIRIENPLLREHLSKSLLKDLQDHLPDNAGQDHPLPKRYEKQICRARAVIDQLNVYADEKKEVFRFEFEQSDSKCLQRFRPGAKERLQRPIWSIAIHLMRHPIYGERILRQKVNIKLLPPAPEK